MIVSYTQRRKRTGLYLYDIKPENCYSLFLTLVLSFQLELARPNYINRKIETFERFIVMQKKTLEQIEHRKIVLVKVESSVTRTIWKRSFNFYWDPKQQSTRRHPVNISFPKNYCNTLERYGRVRIKIKHLYPCFIAFINYGNRSNASALVI